MQSKPHIDLTKERMPKLLLVTILAVAAFTACGTTSEDKTEGTPPDDRLTKSEYIRHGDANCAQALEKTDPAVIPEPRADTPPEWTRYLETRLRVEAPLDAQFKALKAPLADKEVADQLNRDVDAISAKAQEALAAARAANMQRVHELMDQANAINEDFARRAKEYGFKECPKAE